MTDPRRPRADMDVAHDPCPECGIEDVAECRCRSDEDLVRGGQGRDAGEVHGAARAIEAFFTVLLCIGLAWALVEIALAALEWLRS